jgi:hypothetical protein
MKDPAKYTIQYTFTADDIVEQEYDCTTYAFPYAPDIFWTHFRYSMYGIHYIRSMELFMITTNGDHHTLALFDKQTSIPWHDTVWPLPSMPHSKLYFRVSHLTVIQPGESRCLLILLGFFELFPIRSAYLLSSKNEYQYLITKEGIRTITDEIPTNIMKLIPLSEYAIDCNESDKTA